MNEWHEAEQRVERAHEMYRSGRWEDALRELKAALRVNPSQGEWHFNMGMTLEAMGRHAEAVGSYRKALEHHGQESEIFNHIGAASLRAGRPLEALDAFAKSQDLEPHDETPYVYRIDAYRQLGDHENAEVMFYSACQINDENPRTYVLIAQSLLDRGEAEKAIALLERVHDLDARDPDVHAHLGEAYALCGDQDRAIEEYTVQVGLHPRDTQGLLELARLLVESARIVEAAAKLRRVLELDPLCADAHYELGCIALDADHPDAAQMAFEAAIKIDPLLIGAHQQLAAIALLRGKTDEAKRLLASELSLHDAEFVADRRSLEHLSHLLMDAGLHERAVDLLTRLAEGDPHDSEIWHQLSAACFLGDDLHGGIRHARHALRLDPDHLPAIQNLTLAYLARQDLARARYWLKQAERLDSEDPRTRQLKGQWLARSIKHGLKKFFLLG